MLTRYDNFVILAQSLQWDESAIDFAPDKTAWPTLDDTEVATVPFAALGNRCKLGRVVILAHPAAAIRAANASHRSRRPTLCGLSLMMLAMFPPTVLIFH